MLRRGYSNFHLRSPSSWKRRQPKCSCRYEYNSSRYSPMNGLSAGSRIRNKLSVSSDSTRAEDELHAQPIARARPPSRAPHSSYRKSHCALWKYEIPRDALVAQRVARLEPNREYETRKSTLNYAPSNPFVAGDKRESPNRKSAGRSMKIGMDPRSANISSQPEH